MPVVEHRRRRTGAVLALALMVALPGGCVSFDSSPPAESERMAQGSAANVTLTSDYLPPASLTGDRFVTGDGVALPLRVWLPEDRPKAVILALHGFNDYSNAFALPAPRLVADGIALYAYDQRCFGAAPQPGRWAGMDAMANDAALAARLLRQRYPDLPLYLLGESMGGAVAILAVTHESTPVDGVILSAPAVWGRQTMGVFQRVGLWLAGIVPSMRVSQRTVPYTVHPSDNIPMLRALGADPLVIKATRIDTLNGLVDLMSAALAEAPRLAVPALILYGERDEIVPRDPVARLVADLPAAARSRQRAALYAGGYHMLLRGLGAAVVLDDIKAWTRDPSAPLPSGADSGAWAALTGGTGAIARAD